MMEALKRRLGVKPKERIEQPPGTAPGLMLQRIGGEWLVVMLHGGREIQRYTPKEARRMANRFLEMAWLASNPGSCPTGILE
jgi:hypothetical protein